ncbi:MAG: NTP transferase domain-containing protein [Planctomycetes bacterium]|nr:NTP transferase domain-containing protein [Planctomycetota bacterium]
MINIPNMLMVGAGCKADGKTTFTCSLIEKFSSQHDIIGVKISTIDSFNESHHPDVKGTGRDNSPSRSYYITEEKEKSGHTDTARMLAAGAKKVLWLQALNTHLKEGICSLVDMLGDQAVSICESNRARRIIEPGAFVMVSKSQEATWKPSAQEVVGYADRIVVSDSTQFDIDLNDIQLLRNRWALRMPATAIILAGGNSSRMGQDKNMLPINERPMIEHIYKQLGPYFSQIIISANDKARFSFINTTVIQDEVVGKGPLMGITSALRASKNDVNFVIACDIPEVDISLVRTMLRQIGDYDAVIPKVGPSHYEPLFAVYSKKALSLLDKALKSGICRVIDVLNLCNVMYIDLSSRHFTNINTMDDYQKFVEEKTYAGA